jgi:ribosome-binding protein aMBF1 (putative translation factor)
MDPGRERAAYTSAVRAVVGRYATPELRTLAASATYAEIVGGVIEATREGQMTQMDLASRMGLAASTMSRIERGASALTLEQLERVASILGITPSALLRRADRVVQRLKATS